MQDINESRESRRNFLVKTGLLIAATGLWGAAGCSEDETGADSLESPCDRGPDARARHPQAHHAHL